MVGGCFLPKGGGYRDVKIKKIAPHSSLHNMLGIIDKLNGASASIIYGQSQKARNTNISPYNHINLASDRTPSWGSRALDEGLITRDKALLYHITKKGKKVLDKLDLGETVEFKHNFTKIIRAPNPPTLRSVLKTKPDSLVITSLFGAKNEVPSKFRFDRLGRNQFRGEMYNWSGNTWFQDEYNIRISCRRVLGMPAGSHIERELIVSWNKEFPNNKIRSVSWLENGEIDQAHWNAVCEKESKKRKREMDRILKRKKK